jgi:hypothetical protein
MSAEDNKAIVGRWFTEFWGRNYNSDVVDELAAPDIRFEYSLHGPLRGRDAVRDFATTFRAAFPDLAFEDTADLRRGRLCPGAVDRRRDAHRRPDDRSAALPLGWSPQRSSSTSSCPTGTESRSHASSWRCPGTRGLSSRR